MTIHTPTTEQSTTPNTNTPIPDALTQLFTHFHFRTDVFFVGLLCRMGRFDEPNKGYVHLIRQGSCLLYQAHKPPIRIDRPCVLFSPTRLLHRIVPNDDIDSLEIVCLSFDFGEGVYNPLLGGVSQIVPLFLSEYPHLLTIADQIFAESEYKRCGYEVSIQYLCGYLMILVVRCCLEQNILKAGLFLGLSDKQLAPLLANIHNHPDYAWTLDEMANYALMSRAKFSAYFRQKMGVSAMDYVLKWRLSLAQHLLKKGTPMAQVTQAVGYSHTSALTRIFVRELGKTPTQWLTDNEL